MKKLTLVFVFSILGITSSLACTVCKQQQPKILQSITHGAAPESNWDYLIVLIITLIVVATLFLSVLYLVKPGEHNGDHIKYSILNNNSYGK